MKRGPKVIAENTAGRGILVAREQSWIGESVAIRQQSNEELFEQFVEENHERAVHLAWRLLGGKDQALAEDIAQNALIKAYKGIGRFRGDAKISTWFYRIVVREVASRRRWRAVRDKWHRVWRHSDPAESQPQESDPALRSHIRKAVDGLPKGQREAFVLVFIEGLTAGEAAAVLGKAEGTIKSHLNRARHALRAQLKDVWDEK